MKEPNTCRIKLILIRPTAARPRGRSWRCSSHLHGTSPYWIQSSQAPSNGVRHRFLLSGIASSQSALLSTIHMSVLRDDIFKPPSIACIFKIERLGRVEGKERQRALLEVWPVVQSFSKQSPAATNWAHQISTFTCLSRSYCQFKVSVADGIGVDTGYTIDSR